MQICSINQFPNENNYFLNYTETGDKKSQFRNNSQFHESRENMILLVASIDEATF